MHGLAEPSSKIASVMVTRRVIWLGFSEDFKNPKILRLSCLPSKKQSRHAHAMQIAKGRDISHAEVNLQYNILSMRC